LDWVFLESLYLDCEKNTRMAYKLYWKKKNCIWVILLSSILVFLV